MDTKSLKIFCQLFILLMFNQSYCQDNNRMDIESYNPKSTLVVCEHLLTRAKFPFIDVHNHQWEMPAQDLSLLLQQMDSLNMVVMVNLSGRGYKIIPGYHGKELFSVESPSYLAKTMSNVKANGRGRIIVFTNIDFLDIDNPDWTKNTVLQLEKDVKEGANGLKVYKELGLEIKDKNGNRITVDDPRLDAIWEKCGELKIPVLIHSGEPAPFLINRIVPTKDGWN